MPNLNLSKLLIRNFRSYGDYDTEIDLNGLGPVLIIGEIDNNPKKSNGSGKSSIADAIVWGLFGKLPYKSRPSSHIVNHRTGKNCLVKLTTTDGYQIVRTRNYDNHSDLLIIDPEGEDISDSTNTNAQQHLNRLFNLDYEIFTSNVFFTQFGQPFLELTDQKRKKALERMLNLDHFDYYVEVSKEKITSLQNKQARLISKLEIYKHEVEQISIKIENNIDKFNEYEQTRKHDIEQEKLNFPKIDKKFKEFETQLYTQLESQKSELSNIDIYDITQLRQDWTEYQNKLKILDKIRNSIDRIRQAVAALISKKDTLERQQHPEDLNDQVKTLQERLKAAITQFNNTDKYDLSEIKKEWDVYNKKLEFNNEADQKVSNIQQSIYEIEANIRVATKRVDAWENQSGTKCPTCNQPISENHTKIQCKPILEEIDILNNNLKLNNDKTNEITATKLKLTEPSLSISECRIRISDYNDKSHNIKIIKEDIKKLQERQKLNKLQIDNTRAEIIQIEQDIQNKKDFISKKESELINKENAIERSKPKVSVTEAEALKRQYDIQNNEINRTKKEINELDKKKEEEKDLVNKEITRIRSAKNPYQEVIDQQKNDLVESKNNRNGFQSKVDNFDVIIKHIEYIRSAYSDRRKIKSHLLSRLIPFFNERISYYLDIMECSCTLKFSNSLKIEYGLWPYEMWSGGERKRIDLALMFAIHDLHTAIYDKQCNLLIFDEVDGRLDFDGVNRFIEIVFDELSNDSGLKRTILVISHEDTMQDAFPTKIIVRKDKNNEDGCSTIEVR